MKRILVDINHQQSRIAITEDQDLKEFYIERQDHQRLVGNIYKGGWRMFYPVCRRLLSISVLKRMPSYI